jgi:hypothetical protein
MPHIDIPQDLFQQIQQALPASQTADQFVHQAVRDRIAWQKDREEFFRLSDITRQALAERGLSEEDILADFDRHRRE